MYSGYSTLRRQISLCNAGPNPVRSVRSSELRARNGDLRRVVGAQQSFLDAVNASLAWGTNAEQKHEAEIGDRAGTEMLVIS